MFPIVSRYKTQQLEPDFDKQIKVHKMEAELTEFLYFSFNKQLVVVE